MHLLDSTLPDSTRPSSPNRSPSLRERHIPLTPSEANQITSGFVPHREKVAESGTSGEQDE